MGEFEYDAEFYQKTMLEVRRSAGVIVPMVVELVKPNSVLDVGCGIGTWLAAFQAAGVDDVVGLDGEYVPGEMLEIPKDRFFAVDLNEPIQMDRRFDLVVSLEVAEHLHEIAAAGFVRSLTRLGPVVLFSAAIPFQGGEHHVNEQWLDYWSAMFARCGFVIVDCLRTRLWNDESICWWYAQNMVLFVEEGMLPQLPLLVELHSQGAQMPLRVVHPRKYLEVIEHARRDVARLELRNAIPRGSAWILVDDNQIGCGGWGEYRVFPFLENNGEYWGKPADSDEAIKGLEAAIERGARYLVFCWPAFWWLDHYEEFRSYLEAQGERLLASDHLVVYWFGRAPAGSRDQLA